jgi:hypothetical protein
MRKLLLAAAAMCGVLALTTLDVSAAPTRAMPTAQVLPGHGMATNVDYYWHHEHYHHRHWQHHYWHYYN